MTSENESVKDTAVRETVEKIVNELGDTKTIVIREDNALVIHEEKATRIKGIIDSPARWIEKRTSKHESLSAHVIVDRDKMTIELITEERNHFSNSIIGSLEYHPAFLKFGINAGNYITPAQMSDKIKMNRTFFESKTEAMTLVAILKNFKAKVDASVEKLDDNRGNRKDLYQQAVTSNLPPSFKMKLPIFKGQPAKVFEVEVYISPDLECTLISPEANEEMERLRDVAINEVLERIEKVDSEIVVIEK